MVGKIISMEVDKHQGKSDRIWYQVKYYPQEHWRSHLAFKLCRSHLKFNDRDEELDAQDPTSLEDVVCVEELEMDTGGTCHSFGEYESRWKVIRTIQITTWKRTFNVDVVPAGKLTFLMLTRVLAQMDGSAFRSASYELKMYEGHGMRVINYERTTIWTTLYDDAVAYGMRRASKVPHQLKT